MSKDKYNARDTQEPTKLPGSFAHIDGDHSKQYAHPAFGQISASRVSSTGYVLYGSDFIHDHFITLSISESTLHRDLSSDRHHSGNRLIQVALTEGQWATFLSSLNMGRGTPCTIEQVGQESRPRLPRRDQRTVYESEVQGHIRDLTKSVDAALAEIDGEIGASLSKTKREKVTAHLTRLRRTISDAIPFVAKMFEKHMEKTVESAKVEVHAYVGATMHRAGLAAIHSAAPLRLGGGDRTEDPTVDGHNGQKGGT